MNRVLIDEAKTLIDSAYLALDRVKDARTSTRSANCSEKPMSFSLSRISCTCYPA